MQPALQYMAGELRVDCGDVLPLLATHNTVRMRFDIEEAEYLNFCSSDATFPMQNFSMLADTARNKVRAVMHIAAFVAVLHVCIWATASYSTFPYHHIDLDTE